MSGVFASVLFIVIIRCKSVTSIAHTTEEGLSKGENVRKTFFKFAGKWGKSGGLSEFLHHAKLVDGKFCTLSTCLIIKSHFQNFKAL